MQRASRTTLAIAAAFAALAAPASASVLQYQAILTEINGSGVSGRVDFFYDTGLQSLRVRADIMGLVPTLDDGSPALHINHIHGRFNDDGSPRDSVSPTIAQDANGDGFVDVLEAFGQYGDVLLSLEPNPTPASNHVGPFADATGRLTYDLTYDLLSDTPEDGPLFSTVSGTDYTAPDLFPLDLREYVIHGGFVGAGFQNAFLDQPTTGRTFIATLPVATAEISAVPLPAAGLLLLGGLGAMALMRRRQHPA